MITVRSGVRADLLTWLTRACCIVYARRAVTQWEEAGTELTTIRIRLSQTVACTRYSLSSTLIHSCSTFEAADPPQQQQRRRHQPSKTHVAISAQATSSVTASWLM